MDPSISALIGAAVGSMTTLTASYLAHRFNREAETRKWRLTKKEEAYSQCMRALLKVMNSRSLLKSDGTLIFDVNKASEWVENCINAIFWTRQLSIYSPQAFSANGIEEPLRKFEDLVEGLSAGASYFNSNDSTIETVVVRKDGTRVSFSSSYAEVLLWAVEQSAIQDIGKKIV